MQEFKPQPIYEPHQPTHLEEALWERRRQEVHPPQLSGPGAAGQGIIGIISRDGVSSGSCRIESKRLVPDAVFGACERSSELMEGRKSGTPAAFPTDSVGLVFRVPGHAPHVHTRA